MNISLLDSFHHFPLSVLAALSSASPDLAQPVGKHVLERCNAALRDDVEDLRQFWNAMFDTESILGGQFVLSLIDPLQSETFRIIDILTTQANFLRMLQHLLKWEHGLIMQQHVVVPDLAAAGYADAILVETPLTLFRLVSATADSAMEILPHFVSTHYFNFIDPHGLYIAYPEFTFRARGIRRPTVTAPLSASTHIDELSSFRALLLDTAAPNRRCGLSSVCAATVRHFDDNFCCQIQFDPAHPKNPFEPIIMWMLGGPSCATPSCVGYEAHVWRV